jgi:hypothetical protein
VADRQGIGFGWLQNAWLLHARLKILTRGGAPSGQSQHRKPAGRFSEIEDPAVHVRTRDLSITRTAGSLDPARAASPPPFAAAALNALISPFARATMGHTVEHRLGGAGRAACTCQSRGYRSGIDVHVQARPRMQHGKMPLVGGPIVTFALPPYRVCKAMIWLWDKVVAPCLRAVWKACLSPCLLAVWRTCLSPCLLKLHKVLGERCSQSERPSEVKLAYL